MENGAFFALTFRELGSCFSGSGQAENGPCLLKMASQLQSGTCSRSFWHSLATLCLISGDKFTLPFHTAHLLLNRGRLGKAVTLETLTLIPQVRGPA